ncbi:DoxX family membrane protein [Nocardioides panacisoli]|uniref:MauE/DoxX family redox-associated membrane protein n=1 Tax=Nocardioides panacisoli TaxID=627624 RepID=UPI001C627761|nr:MauE/DoxX family redox-associated membrane protein [Nocardioides panacisoli]QYJ04314.1 DoxX family membrane protein [Nocardioides panacisoli]
MNAGVHGWLGLLARLVTGGVWIVAGALKVTDPRASVEAVRAYELLPGSLVEPVGLVLPALELGIGIALVVGALTRGAAVVSAVLFLAFIVGIASVWMRGIEIDCGCFGGGGAEPGAASNYPWEIARDVALLAASAYVVALRRTRWALDNLLFPSIHEEADVEEVPDPEPSREGR